MRKWCEVIKVVTPKRYMLNGLWFGGKEAKTAIVFVHGLTSTAFSNHKLVAPLADESTAVVCFGNRGHDKIAKIGKIDKRRRKGYKSEMIGEVHEVFTDCVDDIQGVINFIKTRGVRDIFLVGHSTGCQKSVYYLSRRGKQKMVKGTVLLCPMSDYASALKVDKDSQLKKAVNLANKYIKEGKADKILPLEIWPHLHDAQRFLSLYTPESKEEIFSYCQKGKQPKTYQSIKIPMLIIFAEKDEYRDRPIRKIGEWFRKNSYSCQLDICVVKNAFHNLRGFEDEITEQIEDWLKRVLVL